jgi:hypothetical protein
MRDLAQPATRPGQNPLPVWLLALAATIGALLIIAGLMLLAGEQKPARPEPTPARLMET